MRSSGFLRPLSDGFGWGLELEAFFAQMGFYTARYSAELLCGLGLSCLISAGSQLDQLAKVQSPPRTAAEESSQ